MVGSHSSAIGITSFHLVVVTHSDCRACLVPGKDVRGRKGKEAWVFTNLGTVIMPTSPLQWDPCWRSGWVDGARNSSREPEGLLQHFCSGVLSCWWRVSYPRLALDLLSSLISYPPESTSLVQRLQACTTHSVYVPLETKLRASDQMHARQSLY